LGRLRQGSRGPLWKKNHAFDPNAMAVRGSSATALRAVAGDSPAPWPEGPRRAGPVTPFAAEWSNPGVEAASSLSSPLGRISISHEAVAHIVGRVTAEAYGVVGMAPRSPRERLLTRDRLRQGITVGGTAEEGVTIELSVVVEYGLNLAEVASTLRNRVRYEVERLTGLRVAEVEVRIQDVKRSSA